MESVIVHISEDNALLNPKAVREFFDQLKGGKKYLLTAKVVDKRSTNQNAYYWSCVISMIKDRMIELGNEVDSELVHDFLKERFNSKELFNKEGTLIGSVGATTTGLSKLEFEEYLDKVRRFALEALDLNVPLPNEPHVLFADYDTEHHLTIVR